MTAVRSNISVSLDGFAAGANQSLEHPLEWAHAASSRHQQHRVLR